MFMNETGKLPQSILGTIAGWILTLIAWFGAHLGLIAGVLAVVSTIYSICASRETIKLRKKQQAALTSKDAQEPETDT